MVDVRPQGRTTKRIRKKFTTKAEAQQYKRWAIATLHNKEWLDKPRHRRALSDRITLLWERCGNTLKGDILHHRIGYLRNSGTINQSTARKAL